MLLLDIALLATSNIALHRNVQHRGERYPDQALPAIGEVK